MASATLVFLIILISIHFFTLTLSQLDLQYNNCYVPNGGTFDPTGPYKPNLEQVLNTLTTDTTVTSGFYNSSAGTGTNKVYARALCRPDMSSETCRDCINVTREILPTVCQNNRSAIGGYDDDKDINCMLRYADYDQFGIMEDKAAAADSPNKYAADFAVASFGRIYGLVQCTPDLNETSCKNCLDSTMTHMTACCDTKQGGRVYTPSCNFRYALNADFFKRVTRPPKEKNHTVIIIVSVIVSVVTLVTLVGIVIFLKRKKWEEEDENVEDIKHTECVQFDLSTIKTATNNFSDANKLGQGGFGAVYKGMLPDGQELAVKRLSTNSRQGEEEFKNEVLLLAKLQHRNLVRLLGFCLERKERILVYEFVPNSSLDHFIFGLTTLVNWETLYKIIGGIARGLLYLHEDSRHRIIHRDLKPSNILLDSEMNPKIADFGLAKLIEMDHTHKTTSRVAGTYGYMAPEYMSLGRASVKADVFSFGVMILEIVMGQRRSEFGSEEEVEDLLTFAWKSWKEGTTLNLIAPALRGDSTTDEMLKCIHIGLLCVQENVNDRPYMASVVHMLNSEILTLPEPSKPGSLMQTTTRRALNGETSSFLKHNSGSAEPKPTKNVSCSVDITEVHGR
ncbi:putative receptor-like protein kinase At4g00960 [Pistacia vera]|uniref:putative receptor-like protein kinase At4g00960 n=1 Tax=Pistacia vera TaxID=55513 RepID=UPI0012635343|nr:putative receptor-like protein kinase At4g00960 [Pistacia vera]